MWMEAPTTGIKPDRHIDRYGEPIALSESPKLFKLFVFSLLSHLRKCFSMLSGEKCCTYLVQARMLEAALVIRFSQHELYTLRACSEILFGIQRVILCIMIVMLAKNSHATEDSTVYS